MHHSAPPVGRNEPCPCGSGEKYKNCCAKSVPQAGSRWSSPYALIALLALFAVAGYLIGVKRKPPAEPSTTVLSTPATLTPVNPAMPTPGTLPPPTAALTPQPPGPVPDGKVWSPEHGHWHDITPPVGSSTQPIQLSPTGDGSPVQMTPMPMTPAPQPPGPVPEGKVWSEEHGHWHDIAPQGAAPLTLQPAAPTLPAEGTPVTPPPN